VDIVSNQLNKIYNIGLMFFLCGYFTAKILHIVPLMLVCVVCGVFS